MIAVLAAPSAPLFTPQRGAPPLPFERLAPKHPGGQFSFWRKLAEDPRRRRLAYGTQEVAASRSAAPQVGATYLDGLCRSDSMVGPRDIGVRLGQLFLASRLPVEAAPGPGSADAHFPL
jgi:hypothetical protein